jgi:hypothetical protein
VEQHPLALSAEHLDRLGGLVEHMVEVRVGHG